MSDLISRDDVITAIRNLYPSAPRVNFMDSLSRWREQNKQFILCEEVIKALPSVDAVPVVRCKDCRFYRFYDGAFGKGWMCFENNTARHGDDYCSWGERKDKT